MISISKIVSYSVAVGLANMLCANQLASCVVAVVVSQIVSGFSDRSHAKKSDCNNSNCKSTQLISKLWILITLICKVQMLYLGLKFTKAAFSISAACWPLLSKIVAWNAFVFNKADEFSTFAGAVATDFVRTPSPVYEIQTCCRIFGVSKRFDQ